MLRSYLMSSSLTYISTVFFFESAGVWRIDVQTSIDSIRSAYVMIFLQFTSVNMAYSSDLCFGSTFGRHIRCNWPLCLVYRNKIGVPVKGR